MQFTAPVFFTITRQSLVVGGGLRCSSMRLCRLTESKTASGGGDHRAGGHFDLAQQRFDFRLLHFQIVLE